MLAEKKHVALEVRHLGMDDASSDEYLAINPLGRVPALALDDGRVLTESLTISQYLDAISGPPFLCGDGLDQRTEIGMWERMAEMELFGPTIEYGHHASPIFAGRLQQFPDWAESTAARPKAFIAMLEKRLAKTRFIAGDLFSIADITAFYGVRFAMVYGLYPAPAPEIVGWLDRVDAWRVTVAAD